MLERGSILVFEFLGKNAIRFIFNQNSKTNIDLPASMLFLTNKCLETCLHLVPVRSYSHFFFNYQNTNVSKLARLNDKSHMVSCEVRN